MSAVDAEILEIFRAEACERLDRIVATLLAAEADGSTAAAVDSIFRDAHSIKGSAAMVGEEAVRDLAHSIEDRLQATRELTPDLIAALLAGTDQLRAAIPQPAQAMRDGEVQSSVRVPTAKIDRLLDTVGESMRRGSVMLAELRQVAIDMRTLPLRTITANYPRAVRDLALEQGKRVRLELEGGDTQLDRVILEGLSENLAHLLRNAVAHGLETVPERERAGKPADGRIVLRAEQRGTMVAIEVLDDGRGVEPELLAQAAEGGSLAAVLSEPGFSTAATVTDVAGRGVGLDAVRDQVESFGGSLEVRSEPGRGTAVTLLLPYSVALMQVLLIERGGELFALPISSVQEVTMLERTLALGGAEAIEVRGRATPLCDLAAVLGASLPALGAAPRAVVACASGLRQAVACDRIVGQQEVVLKSFGALLASVPGYLGGAILDTGAVVPVLDPAFITRRVASRAPIVVERQSQAAPSPKVLVVDDQFTVRELQRSILEAAGYRVATAREGRDAWAQLVTDQEIGLVLTDIDMPEMDGIELLCSIRRDPRRAALPVVVLTSKSREADRQRGAEAGADAYIVKDEFDQRTLLDTVERLLVPA